MSTSLYLDGKNIKRHSINALVNMPHKYGEVYQRSDFCYGMNKKIIYYEALFFNKKICNFYDKDNPPEIYFRDITIKYYDEKEDKYIKMDGFLTTPSNIIFIMHPHVGTYLHELAHFIDDKPGHKESFWDVFKELKWLWSIRDEL